MKKCWDEDPLKRPSASEILNFIKKWVIKPSDVNEDLKNNIMEFINTPIEHNNPITEFHPQAYYKSCLLNFTSEKLNEILEEYKQKFLKLEMIAETYYKNSQMELEIKQIELKEMHSAYQKIKLELVNLEQDNYNLKLNSAVQIRKSAEKENNLQDQIISLQNEKQALTNNLTEQLKQNKLINQQVQIQISQLKQEKINLQEKLTQLEVNIQGLKSQQKSLTEQKKQLENRLNQPQANYQQIKEKKSFKDNMPKTYLQVHKLINKVKNEKAELKAKLEEIVQLEKN
jgi:DNA repair exonuclease SbcCD ATPase subunit